jgi:hypothetical protein
LLRICNSWSGDVIGGPFRRHFCDAANAKRTPPR